MASLADSGAGTLRDAITQAEAAGGDNLINFSIAGTIPLQHSLPDLNGSLTIQGPGASSLVLQEANTTSEPSFGIFTVGVSGPADVTISGLTISGGLAYRGQPAAGNGGAIENLGTLTLSGCTLSNNQANANGGAVDNQGNLTVANCVFSGNSVRSYGFGGAIENDGTANVNGSTFSSNSAYYGGAIDNGTHGQAGTSGAADSGTLSLSDDTFTSNTAAWAGGAVESGAGVVTVSGSSFSKNQAYIGGGVDNFAATTAVVNIDSSSFTANSVAGFYLYGGAINNDAQMTVTNSTFTGNLATASGTGSGFGGAIANGVSGSAGASANLVVSGSTFSGNASDSDGGAIANGATLTVDTCTISANHGYFGAGLSNSGTLTVTASAIINNSSATNYLADGGGIFNNGTATVSNSTIAGNAVHEAQVGNSCDGGGIYNNTSSAAQGTVTLVNDTVEGNYAADFGPGLYANGAGTFILHNTIVAGDTALTASPGPVPDVAGTVGAVSSLSDHNLIGVIDPSANIGLSNGVAGNLVGTLAQPLNPMLGSLQNNGGPTQTVALLPGSPAIDAGDNAFAPGQYDQRGSGFARIVNGTVDIGAFEVQTPPTSPVNPPPGNPPAGAGHAELGAYRPSNGSWSLASDGKPGFNADDRTLLGFSPAGQTVVPVSGDWAGLGTDEIGDFENGTWHLDLNNNGVLDVGETFSFGTTGDVPVPGDYLVKGQECLAVFRSLRDGAGEFLISDPNWLAEGQAGHSIGVAESFIFGAAGDRVVVGDWNGAGLTEVGVFRSAAAFGAPGAAVFSLDVANHHTFDSSTKVFVFGTFTDGVVVGDWNGSGTDKVGVYRPATAFGAPNTAVFSLDTTGAFQFDSASQVFLYGTPTDKFVTGDWAYNTSPAAAAPVDSGVAASLLSISGRTND